MKSRKIMGFMWNQTMGVGGISRGPRNFGGGGGFFFFFGFFFFPGTPPAPRAFFASAIYFVPYVFFFIAR